MKNETFTRLSILALVLAPTFMGGCGDVPAGASVEANNTAPRSTLVELQGWTVYLRRDSTRCGLPASNGLVAEVGPAVEFQSNQTSELESPCGQAPSPGVEISVDGPSVLFDFSNVDQAGVFPAADFEGYELGFVRRCGDPVIAAVSVDAEQSSPGAANLEVSHRYDRIRVDFEQLAYDHDSFVKVDLPLVDVDCVADEDL